MKYSVIYELRKLLQSLYITLAGYIQVCSFQKCFVKSLIFGSDYYTYCLITYSLLTWKCVFFLFFFFPQGKICMNKMGQEVCFEINFVSTSLCYKDEISNKVKYFHFILQAVSFKGLYNVLSTQPVLNKVSTC